jgi:hypothetical protein
MKIFYKKKTTTKNRKYLLDCHNTIVFEAFYNSCYRLAKMAKRFAETQRNQFQRTTNKENMNYLPDLYMQ